MSILAKVVEKCLASIRIRTNISFAGNGNLKVWKPTWIGPSRNVTSSADSGQSRSLKTKVTSDKLVACCLNSRSLIRLRGQDTFAFLQGIITNDIHHLETKPAIYTLLLNHQGRVLYDTILYSCNNPDEIWLECDSSMKESVLKHVKFFRVRKKVEITDGSELNLKVWTVFDPSGGAAASGKSGTSNPKDELSSSSSSEHHSSKREVLYLFPHGNSDENTIEGIRDPRLQNLGWRVLLSPSKEAVIKNFAVRDEKEYRLLRYTLGVGEGTQDLPSGNCFPLESNGDYLHGISFQKGCYIGQELTARTHHTGVVRKRLMPFRFTSGSEVSIDNPTEQKIVSKGSKLVGKVRGISGSHGLVLARVEESSSPDLTLQDHPVSITKPDWWPFAAPKESQVSARS